MSFFFKEYIQNILKKVINQYGFESPFIDVGCGKGHLSRFLSEMGYQGSGVDVSKEGIKKAKKTLKGLKGIGCEVIKDLSDIKTNYKSLVSFDVLEHIKDDEEFMKKMSKLLHKNSYVYILVPTGKFMKEDLIYGHYRRYSKKELIYKLEKNGFMVLDTWNIGFPFFWFARYIINLFIKKPDNINDKKLLENSKKSAYTHPYMKSKLIRFIFSLERLPFLSSIINSILSTQNIFKRLSIGHSIIVFCRLRGE